MSRVLIVKNIGREGPGLLRDVLMKHRIEADVIDLERGEVIPELDGYGALIILGGPDSANDATPVMHMNLTRAKQAIDSGVPYLGICLGHQVLAKAAGGRVVPGAQKEVGFFDSQGDPYSVALTADGLTDPLFDRVPASFRVFQLHGETVQPAPSTVVLAESNGVQAIRVGRSAYGLQMHIEMVPEMLAVWAAQDPELADRSVSDLQQQFAGISTSYLDVGRRVFENFLSLADLTSIDLTESDRQEQAPVR